MPNSLIFVVILAVWAAYLIQHWIRRRDHVATARSVDRFSEAMRVLERRQSMPRADISTPRQRSYSVSLTRPAHPDVVVKRAGRGASVSRRHSARGLLRQRPSAPTLRAAALIAGVLALVIGVTVSVVGLTSWWAALGGAAALLLAITFVRFSVEANRRRASSPVRRTADSRARPRSARPSVPRPVATRPAAERTARRPAPRGRTTGRAAPTPRRSARSVATADTGLAPNAVAFSPTGTPADVPVTAGASTSAVTAGRAAADTAGSPRRSTELYDIEALESAERPLPDPAAGQPTAPVVAPEPGTWSPVPVPPPTYTLKARAPRREEPRPQRGHRLVEDLPFDGHALALDEEFEDLPPVHSVS